MPVIFPDEEVSGFRDHHVPDSTGCVEGGWGKRADVIIKRVPAAIVISMTFALLWELFLTTYTLVLRIKFPLELRIRHCMINLILLVLLDCFLLSSIAHATSQGIQHSHEWDEVGP